MSVRSALSLVLAAAALTACAEPQLEEGELIDPRDNVLEQGLIDCTERTDTGYTQGNSFSISVVTVDGKPVEVATADVYFQMQEAAAADGVGIRIVSGFRTMDQQEYLYGCYVNCNCNNCNLAARPGYSNHQSGHALDLNTSDAGVLTWLNNHADEFGFARTVPSEPWHWEWWGGGPGGGPCSNEAPRGYLDAVTCEGGAAGWAQDPDAPDAAIAVHVYVDGPAGAGRGFAVTASEHRDDLCGAIGSCAHGYHWAIPPSLRDGQPHTVHAYGIDLDGGDNPLLGNAPRSFTCAPPAPPLDAAAGVKRHVTSPDVLVAWGLGFDDVARLGDDVVNAYETAPVWPGAPRMVRGDGAPEVYVLDDAASGDPDSRRHVRDPASLAAWGLDPALIEVRPLAEVQALPLGPPLPAVPFLFRGSGPEVYVLDEAATPDAPDTPDTPDGAEGEGEAAEGEGEAGIDDEGSLEPTSSGARLPPSVAGGCAQASTSGGALAALALVALSRVGGALRRRRSL